MTDTPLSFSSNPKIAKGDVALVFKEDGSIVIQHNVPEVTFTGSITGGTKGAGFVMALAALTLANNEEVFGQALRDAAAMLSGIGKTPTSGSLN